MGEERTINKAKKKKKMPGMWLTFGICANT